MLGEGPSPGEGAVFFDTGYPAGPAKPLAYLGLSIIGRC